MKNEEWKTSMEKERPMSFRHSSFFIFPSSFHSICHDLTQCASARMDRKTNAGERDQMTVASFDRDQFKDIVRFEPKPA
jgi:hypothetical protein